MMAEEHHLTELKPVILANDDYDQTSVKQPYNADLYAEFDGTYTNGDLNNTSYDSQGSFRCQSGRPAHNVPQSDASQTFLQTADYDAQGQLMARSPAPSSPCQNVISSVTASANLNHSLEFLGAENESATDENIERLCNLFRGLPRDMFVNRIIRTYVSCERL